MRSRPAGHTAIPSARAAAARGTAAGLILALAACAGPGGKQTKAVAAVTVENHSDYAWRVEFFERSNAAGGAVAVASAELGPRENRRLALAPGHYRVRSGAGGPDAAAGLKPDAAPDVEVELRAGRTYVWPLGTLLSAESPGP